jgi:hypothetical protein
VRLATEAGETELPFDAVARAKLVITDDLIAAARGSAVNSHVLHPAHRSRTR